MNKKIASSIFLTTLLFSVSAAAESAQSASYLLREICIGNGQMKDQGLENSIRDGNPTGAFQPGNHSLEHLNLAYKTYKAAPQSVRDECHTYSEKQLDDIINKYGK